MREITNEHIAQLIKKQKEWYGKKFKDQWPDMGDAEIFNSFKTGLIGITEQDFARGLSTMLSQKWPPSVPEFRAWCEPNSDWPTAEQAWAIAQAASDEANTVVWTSEMQAACQSCQSLIEINDWFNAARCFKDTYSREVQNAQLRGKRPVYQASLGSNQEHRVLVVREAETKGLLGSSEAMALIGYIEVEKAAPSEFALSMIAKMKQQLEGASHA